MSETPPKLGLVDHYSFFIDKNFTLLTMLFLRISSGHVTQLFHQRCYLTEFWHLMFTIYWLPNVSLVVYFESFQLIDMLKALKMVSLEGQGVKYSVKVLICCIYCDVNPVCLIKSQAGQAHHNRTWPWFFLIHVASIISYCSQKVTERTSIKFFSRRVSQIHSINGILSNCFCIHGLQGLVVEG